MRIHYHIAFSTIVSAILFLLFKSWILSVSALIAGIFIDLDHFIDYFREHGWSLNIKRFFQVYNMGQFNKVVLLLHGWEWLFLIFAVAWAVDWNPWITGTFIGLSHHIILDAINSSSSLKTYSLFWRWTKNFDFDTTFPKMKKFKYGHRLNQ
jgi:hypothetical protein